MKTASLAEWEKFKSGFVPDELKLLEGNPELDDCIASEDYIRAQELAVDWIFHQKLMSV
jgi:hypothetical protein